MTDVDELTIESLDFDYAPPCDNPYHDEVAKWLATHPCCGVKWLWGEIDMAAWKGKCTRGRKFICVTCKGVGVYSEMTYTPIDSK